MSPFGSSGPRTCRVRSNRQRRTRFPRAGGRDVCRPRCSSLDESRGCAAAGSDREEKPRASRPEPARVSEFATSGSQKWRASGSASSSGRSFRRSALATRANSVRQRRCLGLTPLSRSAWRSSTKKLARWESFGTKPGAPGPRRWCLGVWRQTPGLLFRHPFVGCRQQRSARVSARAPSPDPQGRVL